MNYMPIRARQKIQNFLEKGGFLLEGRKEIWKSLERLTKTLDQQQKIHNKKSESSITNMAERALRC